jgi:hypothetical protein
MTKRSKILREKLANLEDEFRILLPDCLQKAATGRWGLFDQDAHADPEGKIWNWPEARRVKELAQEIQQLNQTFGTSNDLCNEFQRLRSLQGSNVPGEPRLASDLLRILQTTGL